MPSGSLYDPDANAHLLTSIYAGWQGFASALPGMPAKEALAILCLAIHNSRTELRRALGRLVMGTFERPEWEELFVVAEEMVRRRMYAYASREGEQDTIVISQLPGMAGVVPFPYSRLLENIATLLHCERDTIAAAVIAKAKPARAVELAEALALAETVLAKCGCSIEPGATALQKQAWHLKTVALKQLEG